MLNDSILDTINKLLGIMPEFTEFDVDIIANINASFDKLKQAGVGSPMFVLTSNKEKWKDFVDYDYYSYCGMVARFVFLDVKRTWDTSNSSLASVYKEELNELIWRLNIQVDPKNRF